MAIKVEESKFIWKNGKFLNWDEAKTHIITHSLHYGSGIFEGIRFYETEKGTVIFRAKEHFERFLRSGKKIHLEIPYTQEDFTKIAVELVQKNEVTQGYMRPVAYFGEGYMGLDPTSADTDIALALWPWKAYLSESKTLRAHVSSVRRLTPQQTDMHVKLTGHYFNSILASQEARGLGYNEAILLDQNGNVAEGPGENIFIVKNGTLITPAENFILPGITRDSILEIARDEKIKVEERTITIEELYQADEAFFTGTAAEVSLISEIDGHMMKNQDLPLSTKLKKLYEDAARGRTTKYEKWLTRIEARNSKH